MSENDAPYGCVNCGHTFILSNDTPHMCGAFVPNGIGEGRYVNGVLCPECWIIHFAEAEREYRRLVSEDIF